MIKFFIILVIVGFVYTDSADPVPYKPFMSMLDPATIMANIQNSMREMMSRDMLANQKNGQSVRSVVTMKDGVPAMQTTFVTKKDGEVTKQTFRND